MRALSRTELTRPGVAIAALVLSCAVGVSGCAVPSSVAVSSSPATRAAGTGPGGVPAHNPASQAGTSGASEGTLTGSGLVQQVRVQRPIGVLHLEVHEQRNQLLVVGPDNEVVRQIPVAGNPAVQKPEISRVADRMVESADYAYEWRLPHFVRLIEGRGVGTHAIPLSVENGSPAQAVHELGLDVGQAPRSHGCLRMTDENAKWVFDSIPAGTPVYWL